MKKKWTRWLSFLGICLLLLGSMGTAYAAEETLTVNVDVTYGQTEARGMLEGINEFRTGSEAWYRDKNGNKVTVSSRQELVYDYALEQIAMQRAVEIALSYGHTRPDGTLCFTCQYEGVSTNGENIAMGIRLSADRVLEEWKETEDDFDGQGHRRIMLGVKDDGSDFPVVAVGIGHVKLNGVDYWVQEFGVSTSGMAETQAKNSEERRSVQVAQSTLKDVAFQAPSSLQIAFGESTAAPDASATVPPTAVWEPSKTVIVTPNWTAADSSVAEVLNNQIIGKKVGKTDLTAKVGNQDLRISVEVMPISIETANIILNPDHFTYNGNVFTPDVTVQLGNGSLVKGTDYTVTYENNQKVGTGKAIVTGTGNYTGTLEKTFEIEPCTHQWQETQRVEPTCAKEGRQDYFCALCGDTKSESIAKRPHTPVEVPALAPTCTEDGHTAGSACGVCGELLGETKVIPALGHKWDEGTVLKEATHAEEGSIRYVCSVCQEEKMEVIPRLTYKITQGADQTLAQETDAKKGLTITCDGPLEKMVSLEIDGKLVDPKNYEAVSGSTIITVKPEYLATLSTGTHTWRLNYEDGSVETTFMLKKTTQEPTTGANQGTTAAAGGNQGTNSSGRPTSAAGSNLNTNTGSSVQTADSNAPGLWLLLLIISLVGVFTAFRYNKISRS